MRSRCENCRRCWRMSGASSRAAQSRRSTMRADAAWQSKQILYPHSERAVGLHVGFCQQRYALFNHLICASEQHGWHLEPQCFGGPQIDQQVQLRGKLNRQVCWLDAAQDPIDVVGSPVKAPNQVDAVADETARLDV